MDNEARLTGIKRVFYNTLLGNPVLARIILEAMDETGNSHLDPDFMAEPWYDRRTGAIGLAYKQSTSAQEDALAYIEILLLTSKLSDASLLCVPDSSGMLYYDGSAALMGLTNVTPDERELAACYFMREWQEFHRTVREYLGAEIDFDTGMFTTKPRSYKTF